ncbi:hypothetical protein FSARC_14831 [Fusarium sarcochroum]|uniref:Uncharacterized protein n=1 Tax=Fusarium sarcochroum TaxID=1208366 RepID=A0A8H4SQF9_9HYPO|nr:hypothetical protein FSARC_14831 [Fusarium sarcochroum]
MTAIIILPLRYQSQDIALSDWITVLTLCLAPLIAHVLIGAPSPTYLSISRPSWHERICHYNPTSIIWRYAMITDRRIRAKNWDKVDLAATNALFWTDGGWDGSEEIINFSRPRCVQLPDSNMVTLLSRDAIKTLIVTLQGLQAVVLLLGSQIDPTAPRFNVFMGVDIIFFPVALFGLLRLCSCLWLTDEFAFASMDDTPLNNCSEMIGCSTTSFQLLPANPLIPEPRRFRRTSSWASRASRVVFTTMMLALLALALSFIVQIGQVVVYTTTTFVVVLFYLWILAGTTLISIWYLFFKKSTSTVIPCISSIWYKVYTGVVIGFGIAVIAIACIETRKTPCGKFTSGYGINADLSACMDSRFDITEHRKTIDGPYSGNTTWHFTKASNTSFVSVNYEDDKQNVLNFTRLCFSSKWGI